MHPIMNSHTPTQRLYPDLVPTGTKLASPGNKYATDAAAEPNPLPPLVTTNTGMVKPKVGKYPDLWSNGDQT